MAQEKQFENKVKKFLSDHECWNLKYWGGGAYTRAGVPDLLICCNGYFLGIELKAENGKPTDLQLHTLSQIRKSGGVGILLYPHHWDEFQEYILKLLVGFEPAELDFYKFIYKEEQ